MRNRNKYRIKKPKFLLNFVAVFIITVALVLGGLCVLVLTEFEERHYEIDMLFEEDMREVVRLLENVTKKFSERLEEGADYEELYREYKGIVDARIAVYSNMFLVDPQENEEKYEILTDLDSSEIYCFQLYTKDVQEAAGKMFSFSAYTWYRDDPELMALYEKETENPSPLHSFFLEEVYVNEQTKEYIPTVVRWSTFDGKIEKCTDLEIYTRSIPIPEGFVKDEIGTMNSFIQAKQDKWTNPYDEYIVPFSWYETITYGYSYDLGYREEARERILFHINNSYSMTSYSTNYYFTPSYIKYSDSPGKCYREKGEFLQLWTKQGDMKKYQLIWAIQYSLWDIYKYSILNTVKWCVIGSAVFSFLAAVILYQRKKHIWQQNAFCNTLTNAVAHDLKTPLMVISGMTENLKECVTEEKPLYYADQVTDTVAYMNRMIEDILNLNRMQHEKGLLRREWLDIQEVLEKVIERYQVPAAEKKLVITMTGGAKCKGDEALLREAFSNLIENAVRYTPEGEKITVEIHPHDVTITNTGVTLPKSFLCKAFDPFAKGDVARSNRKGSGIGLSIAKNIFDMHCMACTIRSLENAVMVKVKLDNHPLTMDLDDWAEMAGIWKK